MLGLVEGAKDFRQDAGLFANFTQGSRLGLLTGSHASLGQPPLIW
jgi:hypothetical protein